jgi:hypothetical protein
MNLSRSNVYCCPWNVVVTAKGFGAGWHICHSPADQDVVIVLEPESHLHGRLLDSRGQPAAGVSVRITSINDRFNPDPRALFDMD